jgi:hypothetical protein
MLQRSLDVGLAHAGISLARLAEKRGDLVAARKYMMQGFEPLSFGLPAGGNEILVRGMYGNAQERAAAIEFVDRYLASRPHPVSAVVASAMVRLEPRRALLQFQDNPTNNDSMFLSPLFESHEALALPEFAEFARHAGLAQAWDKFGPPDMCRKNEAGDYVCH